MGIKGKEGDEAFYYLHNEEGFLRGAVITHVDYFTLAGTSSFIEEVLDMVKRELTISKIECDNFLYTGLDISTKKLRWQTMLQVGKVSSKSGKLTKMMT